MSDARAVLSTEPSPWIQGKTWYFMLLPSVRVFMNSNFLLWQTHLPSNNRSMLRDGVDVEVVHL